jgi:hypothetical protein
MTSGTSSGRHRIQEMLFGPGIGKSGWTVATYRGVTITSIPGAGRGRWWLANSRSACDTAGMVTFSRAISRWEPMRVAAAGVALALVLAVGAYVVAAAVAHPTPGGVVAAAAALAIAGAGLLYAFRLGAGGPLD